MADLDANDFDNLLIDGVAQLLVAAGVGVYRPTAAYESTDTAITAQILPTSPDSALALATYPISDDPSLSDSIIGVQVFTRTGGDDPRPTNLLAGKVFNRLHGLHDTDLASGVRVVNSERRSGALLGQDDLRRWERVDNYYLTVWRPSLNRI